MILTYERLNSLNVAAAKEIIISGLSEYFPEYNEALNPDVEEMESYYDEKRAVLFVGRNANQEIISTGALEYVDPQTVELKRISVTSMHKSHGFGKDMVRFLENQARKAGYERVILETTKKWTGVVRFYLKIGYSVTHEKNGDIYFEKLL